ncbi:MAG: AAA family ATPase, partial [Mycobacterium sp.]
MSAYERLLDALRDHGSRVDERDGRSMAQCPAHNDGHPSLAVTRIDGSVLLHCHAGCDIGAVLAPLSLTPRDLYDDPRGAVYAYPDGRNVHRSPAKQFHQSGNTKGRSLFHADRIGDASAVYVAEGEKDVLAIEAAGGVAVCPAMGAGKAHKFDWSRLRG